MATLEAQNPVVNELPQVSVATPEYETAKPNAVNRFKNAVHNRYVSSVRFILTIHGLLNVVIIVSTYLSASNELFINKYYRLHLLVY